MFWLFILSGGDTAARFASDSDRQEWEEEQKVGCYAKEIPYFIRLWVD